MSTGGSQGALGPEWSAWVVSPWGGLSKGWQRPSESAHIAEGQTLGRSVANGRL